MYNYNRQNIDRNNCHMPQKPENECPCSDKSLAMAYVPWQHFDQVYELPMALSIGTIFPELNKPFRGSKGGLKCSCRQ